MMSWLGVFYVAYRLIKEQMDRSYAKVEAERMRREHPYRTIMSDWSDPRNDEILFTWEEKNPELVKQRQKRQKEKLEAALRFLEQRQAELNRKKANGTFMQEDEETQKSIDWHREYYSGKNRRRNKDGYVIRA